MGRAFACAVLAAAVCAAACSRSTDPDPHSVRVQVRGVAVDERSQSPVVILEEENGARRLPIWIGFPEASSIASELQSISAQRPNTHDLVKRLIDGLDGQVARVVVTDLEGGVYYARIVLEQDGRRFDVDARPSDAIAIALRSRAPVFVDERLFEKALEAVGGEGDRI